MKITLIGMGSGCPESLTVQGYAALREADLILGARRLLSALPAGCTENRAAAYLPDEILELLHASGCENAALLYSGDTGFYSGASALVERLQAQGYRPVVPAFPACRCSLPRWAAPGRTGSSSRPMAAPATRWPSAWRASLRSF